MSTNKSQGVLSRDRNSGGRAAALASPQDKIPKARSLALGCPPQARQLTLGSRWGPDTQPRFYLYLRGLGSHRSVGPPMPPSHKAVSGLGAAVNLEVTLQGCAGHMGTWLLRKGRKAQEEHSGGATSHFKDPADWKRLRRSQARLRGACKDSCVAGKTALLSSLLMVLGAAL